MGDCFVVFFQWGTRMTASCTLNDQNDYFPEEVFVLRVTFFSFIHWLKNMINFSFNLNEEVYVF
jgi:hypothetical protein